MRIWDYFVCFVLFGSVSAFHGMSPIRIQSSGFRRIPSRSIFRPSRQSLYPRYQPFGRLESLPTIFRYPRRRFYDDFNDFNLNNNFDNFDNFNNFDDNNGGRLASFSPSFSRGFPGRSISLSRRRIVPRRIRIPLRMQRGMGGRIPLNPIRTDRRVPFVQRSGLSRVSGGRVSSRRTTGRRSTDMRKIEDEVLALFAVDDRGTSQSAQGSAVDIPLASEVVAPGIKRVPIKSSRKSEKTKEIEESKIVRSKVTKKEVKESKVIKKDDAFPEKHGRHIGKATKEVSESTQIAKEEIEATVAKVQKKKLDISIPETGSKPETHTVDKKKEVIAIVPEVNINVSTETKATSKSDIKVADADTVNIKAEKVLADSEGAAIEKAVGEEVVKDVVKDVANVVKDVVNTIEA